MYLQCEWTQLGILLVAQENINVKSPRVLTFCGTIIRVALRRDSAAAVDLRVLVIWGILKLLWSNNWQVGSESSGGHVPIDICLIYQEMAR